jgi:hypothetical protein
MYARLGVLASFLGVSFVALPATPRSRVDPYKLFLRSSQSSCPYNVVALIDQRDPLVDSWQRVKIVRDRHGVVFKSVLSPLKMQGVKSLDDGVRWRTLLPDEKSVMDQRSPLATIHGLQSRLSRAHRNYRFKLTGTHEIAERPCYVVSVQPIAPDLPTWTLYLDTSTCYPLRVDTKDSEGSRVEFTSRTIDYPKTLDPDLMTLDVPLGFKVVSFDIPENFSSPSSAKAELGFDPIIPNKLPYGFGVEDLQISRSSEWSSLIVRLTDGMARASVYEYVPGRRLKSVRPFENSSRSSVGEVRLMIVSDVSESCRQKLLSSFTLRDSR